MKAAGLASAKALGQDYGWCNTEAAEASVADTGRGSNGAQGQQWGRQIEQDLNLDLTYGSLGEFQIEGPQRY